MAHYRLYFMDAANRIATAVDLDCDGEDALDGCVTEHSDGRAMEVWYGTTCLKKYPATMRSIPQAASRTKT